MLNKSISLTKIFATFCFLIAASGASASKPVADDPDWIFHSSFDNRPRKIVDTPDAVYFFVHQTPYSRTDYNQYYSTPNGAVFYIDKSDTASGIHDLHRTANLSGGDMRMFAVEPVTGLVIIAYNDGGIDLVTKEHKVKYISAIRDRNFPGASQISSISFDPVSHNVWIGAGTGYLCISATTLSPLHDVEWGEPVNDICPAGDRIIAIINGAIHEAPAGTDVRRRNSFRAIPSVTTGIAGTPVHLFPLGDSFFGYVTTTGAVIKGKLLASGTWDREAFVYDSAILQNEANTVTDRMEHTVMPTARGYYISSAAKAYLIDAPETPGQAPSFKTVAMPSGGTCHSSSYDQKTFWTYRERGEFLSRTLNGSAWSEPAVYKTEAPLVCKDVDFMYSPVHGLIAVNREPNRKMDFVSTVMPVLTSAYREGKWTNLSTAHHRPYYADENKAFINTWNSKRDLFPLGNPMGSVVDPLFPDYMHSGSNWCGYASTNLADPKKYPLLTTVNGYAFASYPCLKTLPKQTWGTFTGTFCAGFDADNVLWMFRSRGYDSDDSRKNDITFRYWTPEARRAALESGDPSLADTWKEIYVKSDPMPVFWTVAKAMKHPRNKNRLIASFQDGAERGPALSGSAIVIYNHKGTLDDSSDDSVTPVYRLQVENGALMPFGFINDIQENPLTGEVILLAYNDTFIIDPTAPVSNGIMPAKILTFGSEGGSECEFLSPVTATCACFDEYNRLWIGAESGGVIGLNADRSELIAHYTTQNSPLPSDGIYGLGWNPETKSLFISTDMGIVETKFDSDAQAADAGSLTDPYVMPRTVRPEYAGTVAIHNIPAGVSLKVSDADGNIVADIPPAVNGVTYWNLLDRSGRLVPTGRYTISDATATRDFPAQTVVVTR